MLNINMKEYLWSEISDEYCCKFGASKKIFVINIQKWLLIQLEEDGELGSIHPNKVEAYELSLALEYLSIR